MECMKKGLKAINELDLRENNYKLEILNKIEVMHTDLKQQIGTLVSGNMKDGEEKTSKGLLRKVGDPSSECDVKMSPTPNSMIKKRLYEYRRTTIKWYHVKIFYKKIQDISKELLTIDPTVSDGNIINWIFRMLPKFIQTC